MIPDEIVDRVRDEADIVAIIGEYVKLKRVGTSFRGPCPFHQGKHDNFSVLPRGSYVCFVCGEKGNVFTFVQKRVGLDFVEAVKWVGQRVGIEVHETGRARAEVDPRDPLWEVNAAAAEFFQKQLWTEPGGSAAREYLAARYIGREEGERFGLGASPRDPAAMRGHLAALGFDDERQLAAGLLVRRQESDELRPRFRQRLMFPIFDARDRVAGFGGRVLGIGEPKYLNSGESEVFAKRSLLYGLNWARQAMRRADRVLLVEGYFDAIRLMLAGVEEVVAPLGTALTEQQAKAIRKYTRNVVLLYDSDGAGQRATFRAGDELLRAGAHVRVVTLPDGEDPDSYVATHGAEGLERLIAESIDVFDRKVQLLERSGWFEDLMHKRQALDKLLPTIRATADPLLRDLYVARTSEVAGASRERLMEELSAAPDRGQRIAEASRGVGAPPPPSGRGEGPLRVRRGDRRSDYLAAGAHAERELVRIVLHERRFFDVVRDRVQPERFADPGLGRIMSALLELGASATVEDIASGIDAEEIALLESLLDERGGLDHAEEMLAGSIAALDARAYYARLAEIDRISAVATPEQQDALIHEKVKLQASLKAMGKGRYKAFRAPST